MPVTSQMIADTADATGEANEDNLSLFGPDVPSLKHDVITLIPTLSVGISSFSPETLDWIGSHVPWVDHVGNGLQVNSPGVFGYDLRGDIVAEVNFGVDLEYNIDFGHMSSHATVSVPMPEGQNGQNAQLFTNYLLDTNSAIFNVSLNSIGPQTATTVDLVTHGNFAVGLDNFGVYDDGEATDWVTDLVFQRDLGTRYNIINLDPNDPNNVVTLDAGPVSGYVTVPRLPELGVSVSGQGTSVLTGASQTGSGSPFADISFDPISLIPVLGQINAGSYPLIASPAVDAGVDWRLITAQVGISAALEQTLSLTVTNIAVHTAVSELDTGGVYHEVSHNDGYVGDTMYLNFTTGDHLDTRIDETYTITAHLDTAVALKFFGHIDLGLLHVEGYVNPYAFDEMRGTFDLWKDSFPFDLASIHIGSTGYDFTFAPITVSALVDTHLAVTGSDISETLNMALNQVGVDGMGGDDVINGNATANSILGGLGNDSLYGGGGNDSLDGGDGWDELYGEDGNDILRTGTGGTSDLREYAEGGAGNDTFIIGPARGSFLGGEGNDLFSLAAAKTGGQVVHGGDGIDTLYADLSVITQDLSLDFSTDSGGGVLLPAAEGVEESAFSEMEVFSVALGFGNDTVLGNVGADSFYGGFGADNLTGYEGNDILDGGFDNDTLDGGADNDTLTGGTGNDLIYAGDGFDHADGGLGADTLYGGYGNKVFSGGSGDDVLWGDWESLDTDHYVDLHGDGGNDVLHAGLGFMGVVTGDEGNDTIIALGGRNQHFEGGNGSDYFLIGFQNTDTLIMGGHATVDGSNHVVNLDKPGEVGADTLILQSLVTSTDHDPDASADAAPYLSQDIRDAILTFTWNGKGHLNNGDIYDGIENFSFSGFLGTDAIVTGRGDDLLFGAAGDDFLDGGLGHNDIDGDSGNDILVGHMGDRIDGGDGIDTLIWRNDISNPTFYNLSLSLGLREGGDNLGSATRNTEIVSMERLLMIDGSLGNDTISGGNLGDVLIGGKGIDRMYGLAGNDTFALGTGDVARGGEGNDVIVLVDDGQVVNPSQRYSTRSALYGDAGNDTIAATTSVYRIFGGTGNDDISIIVGANSDGHVTNIYGEAGNDTIMGSAAADWIGGGADARFLPAEVHDRIPVITGSGIDDDYVDGAGGDDRIYGGGGNDIIIGGTGKDQLFGGMGDDTVTGSGADMILAEAGDDWIMAESLGGLMSIDGGDGIDGISFNLGDLHAGVTYSAAYTTNYVGGVLKIRAVERLDATFTDFGDSIRAGDYADVITGGLGADTIAGGGAGDLIYAGGNPDHGGPGVYDGDLGGDIIDAGAGDDTIYIGAVATVKGNLGHDRLEIYGLNSRLDGLTLGNGANDFGGGFVISGIEDYGYTAVRSGPGVTLATGIGNDTLRGTDLADHLDGGRGNNLVFGFGGDDVLTTRTGDGFSTLDGGDGVDTAVIDYSTFDEDMTVNAGSFGPGGPGFAPVSLINIEKVALSTGSGNDYVTGSSSADIIKTGAGNDTVSDTGGADDIDLGAGDDKLTDFSFAGLAVETFRGGAGNDDMTIGNQRAWVDLGAGNDIIRVQEFFYDLPAYDTPDTIFGGSGNDQIISLSFGVFDGGSGNDLLKTSLAKATNLTLDIRAGQVNTVRTGWTFTNFERYDLTFSAGNDTIAIDYGQHVLNGGGGSSDSLTIRVGAYADSSYSVTIDPFDGPVYTFANGMVVKGFEHVTIDVAPVSVPGTSGDDVIKGGNGNDSFAGLDGNDSLAGRVGDDLLLGGLGVDTLYGGDGDDTLRGGADIDYLWGGAGEDTFVFEARALNGRDRLTDFVSGEDHLAFKGSDYGFAPGHALTSDEYTVGSAAVGAHGQFVYDPTSHILYWDSNGSLAGGSTSLAVFNTGSGPTLSDFVFT